MENTLPAPTAILLAAGASTRMGSVKALLPIGEECAVRYLARQLLSLCAECVVVTGYHSTAVAGAVEGIAGVRTVQNPQPEHGQLSSLQAGVRSLGEDHDGWFLFTPVDAFGIGPGLLQAMGPALREAADDMLLVIPRCGGRRGHPVAVRRRLAPALLELPVTATARDVIGAHRQWTRYVDVEDPAFLTDVDTPADYQAFLAARRQGWLHE